MKAVIVEDHPDISKELVEMLAETCPEIEVTGAAETVVSAARLIREQSPELLFLDVELPDGTGFDLLDIVDKPLKVIFITGSDAHAMRAFRYAALDYILKPVGSDELKEAVQRAGSDIAIDRSRIDLYRNSLSGNTQAQKRIALHTAEKIHFIDIADIMRCMADGNYTRFYLKDKSSLLVSKTLKDYDNLLAGSDFVRVHQSHLVNMGHVREYVKSDGGYLVMTDGAKIPVSTRKKSEVLEKFNHLPHA